MQSFCHGKTAGRSAAKIKHLRRYAVARLGFVTGYIGRICLIATVKADWPLAERIAGKRPEHNDCRQRNHCLRQKVTRIGAGDRVYYRLRGASTAEQMSLPQTRH